MNSLITISNGIALLDAETSHKIAEMESVIKEMKKIEDDLKQRILDEMEANGIKKIETEEMTITYKASYDKETFQSKEFRADHADLYDSYVKMSPVKSSITIKLKEDK